MHIFDAHTRSLLDAQFGAVARFQLLERHTRGEVDSMVTRRAIVPIERGVYATWGSPATPERAAMAALLRARPSARLTGPFVLAQLGLEPFRRADPFEVLIDPDRRMSGVAFPFRSDPRWSRRLTPIGKLRCVHPTVALIDSLPRLDERPARVALHVLRRRGLWSEREWASERSARGERDAGVALLATMVADGEMEVDSPEELALGEHLRAVDDGFEPQVWITERYRVDWFLRRLRLAFEYQGEVDHAFLGGRDSDATKAAEAARVGVKVVPVVASDLRDPNVRTWIRSIVAAREFELARAAR